MRKAAEEPRDDDDEFVEADEDAMVERRNAFCAVRSALALSSVPTLQRS
jgi:hypothetical protein